ncbi:MAG: glucose-6-phosphate dehydrogenase assembly protein OpcA [Prosthecobacter sp.]|uniref:glucose-6-phosphate dehydrogenase assembly protein OpcA n=1 Tax=Prosthecobacter sp. TaxID=1965333 RepID=UPI003BB1E391
MPLSTINDSDLDRLGLETPIGRIDRALKQLWEGDEAKTRASLINLAIYTEDGCQLVADNELLDHVAAQHACRALLILALPEAQPPRARAWIQALCRPYQGKQIVCSEQISFVLEGGNAAQVQNIVFAHLDSDLPLVVWWQADLSKNFEERLYSRIDTLIIDSARWEDPAKQFDALLAAMNAESGDFDVRDLAWTRSHFMRTALAACFQDATACHNLSKLQSIRITHLKGQRTTALLLAAWINQRLHASLSVELIEKDSGPALQGLVLEGEGVRGEVRRDCDSCFVRVSATCGEHTREDLLPADVDSDAELVTELLSRFHGSTLYSSMLPFVRSMLK